MEEYTFQEAAHNTERKKTARHKWTVQHSLPKKIQGNQFHCRETGYQIFHHLFLVLNG